MSDMNINFLGLVGNHDTPKKNTNDVNAWDELFSEVKTVQFFSGPQDIVLDGLKIALVPWINGENQQQTFEFLSTTKAEVVFGHLELAGFEMDKGNICQFGLDRNIFSRFDQVFSGHFHHKSRKGNIDYLGSQYEMTWHDHNDPKAFHIYDTETRELTPIYNPYKMFHSIVYDDAAPELRRGDGSAEVHRLHGKLSQGRRRQQDEACCVRRVHATRIANSGPLDTNIAEDFRLFLV
jgi:DNA repair exonuclease SbcCD nuclease subunit